MIKLTRIESTVGPSRSQASLLIIPGGPGVTSSTLRNLDVLKRSFNLIYLDISDQDIENLSFDTIVSNTLDQLPATEKLIVVSHSFGSVVAAHFWKTASGFVFLAPMVTQESHDSLVAQYQAHMTNELKLKENDWAAHASDETFKQWLAAYGKLFFLLSKKDSRELILNDPSSAQVFKRLRGAAADLDFLKEKLKTTTVKKIMLAGSDDHLITPASVCEQALKTNSKFINIDNAAHFITFDQPEAVAAAVERSFSDGNKELG